MEDWRIRFRKWNSEKLPDGNFRMLLFDDALLPIALTRTASAIQESIMVILPDASALERVSTGLPPLLELIGENRKLIPLPDVSPSRQLWIPENEAGRCAALEYALEGKPAIYLTTPNVLLAQTLAPKSFKKQTFTIRKGDTISPGELAAKLVDIDYDNELEVHIPGEFSRRGGIFDVFSPLYEAPIRIEFWGDEIDSLRFFMPDTQRSFKDADELRIVPRGTAVLDAEAKQTAFVKDFFPKDIQIVLVDQTNINDHVTSYLDAETARKWENYQASFKHVIEMVIRTADYSDDKAKSFRLTAVSLGEELATMMPELGDGAALWHWQQLSSSIKRWNDSGNIVVACCAEKGEADRFRQLIAEHKATGKLPILIEQLPLAEGLLLPEAKLVLLSSQELFGRKTKGHRKKLIDYKHDSRFNDTMDFEEGAFVVHVTHGIAIFRGIQMLENNGDLQEVMVLEFEAGSKLFVPLEESFLVSRYLGAGKSQPKLSKMGSVSWRNAKNSAENSANDLAAELLRIEAMRQSSTGHSMKPVVEWERSFANSFPYTETPDQAEAIRTVLKDMEDSKPMDRLLCGDVGYGKTEVAIRAAFRAVLNGKQVAMLVPTTVLAQQHYQTFTERMAEYPISIDVISRFRSTKEQNEVLEKAAAGEVDILIGTHRIIQKDVHFRKLGLLIIDEEQRFGVEHKQRLKSMRADLDILTMTATPIPRTLYFSLSGIRNLSTIMTAPVDRLPVSTIVANYDLELIKMAIRRELERQGQVFLLYNRVETIGKFAEAMQALVPDARIAIAHGQMRDGELEKIMYRFVKQEYDVLICTTIVESGVDIPNVNTIIIDRADRFGLSELYQLRGRVGRHDRQAYCYLLLPPMGHLPENARERMAAIRKYTNLGAGFKLAMRDLEIRGAGNILGVEQSGHIAAVGFDLYCQLLKDAVNGMLKKQVKIRKKCEIALDRVVFAIRAASGKTAVGLAPTYIKDMNARIDFYKRLNKLEDEATLQSIEAELLDRFGPLPEQAKDLLEYNRLRIVATKKNIISISIFGSKILVETSHGLFRDMRHNLPISDARNGKMQIQEAFDIIKRIP